MLSLTAVIVPLLLGSQEKKETGNSAPTLANRALLLRTQQELERWQEKYRDYSVLLRNIDTLASPDIDREVIQKERDRHCYLLA